MSNETLDTESIIRNAQTLYAVLPRVGFTLKTFEELGRSAGVGIPFGHLSSGLKVALFTLVRELHAAGVGPTVTIPPRQDDVATPELTVEELAEQSRHVEADEQASREVETDVESESEDSVESESEDGDEPEEVAATATTVVTSAGLL